jgi:hypothetical protein
MVWFVLGYCNLKQLYSAIWRNHEVNAAAKSHFMGALINQQKKARHKPGFYTAKRAL